VKAEAAPDAKRQAVSSRRGASLPADARWA